MVRYKKMPTLRPTKIKLELANYDVPLIANGSDFVTVIASITDDSGNIKRLNNSTIHFEVEGEGELLTMAKYWQIREEWHGELLQYLFVRQLKQA